MEGRTPLIFVGHGNPMNAIEDNPFSLMWKKIGASIRPPDAIVCMSAHWLTSGSYITSRPDPGLIYDFYGFPEKLYRVIYPAKGSPPIAKRINEANPAIKLDNGRGIDHGTWSVLCRMFPDAAIPVLQISIDYSHPPALQVALFEKLKQLRREGVMFIGSGNIVHNLGMMNRGGKPYEWALEFEHRAKNLIENGDKESLLHYDKLGHSAALSIPTDDHYRPLLNTLALMDKGEKPEFFNEGIDLGSVSMLSFICR